jgi:hypothetical protein
MNNSAFTDLPSRPRRRTVPKSEWSPERVALEAKINASTRSLIPIVAQSFGLNVPALLAVFDDV